jgi:hypothetical protein
MAGSETKKEEKLEKKAVIDTVDVFVSILDRKKVV